MNKILDTYLVKPAKLAGLAVLRFTGLRKVHDEEARIKELQKKNKERVIECSVCGKVMKGAKDEKSDSDEEVLYTCESCGFKRDIRKERITFKSISQFYGENQRKSQQVLEIPGDVYKSPPGKLPNNNPCKAVFIYYEDNRDQEKNKKEDDKEEKSPNCPYCGEQLINLTQIGRNIDQAIEAAKKSKNKKLLETNEKEKQEWLKEYNEIVKNRRLPPTRMLPFVVPFDQVQRIFSAWVKRSGWFIPNSLYTKDFQGATMGVYVPQFYIQKGQTRSTWQATGEGSQNRVRRQPKDKANSNQGKKGGKEEMHVLLQSGYLEGEFSFENNGSSGLMGDLMSQIRDLDGKKLVPYDPGYLKGWFYELYQKDVSSSFKNWQKKLNESLSKEAKKRVHGNLYTKIQNDGKKFEDLEVKTEVTNQKVEHILMPIWVAHYTYTNIWKKKRSYQLLINGYTGKVTGKRPDSWWKKVLFGVIIWAVGSILVWLAHTYWHSG